MADNAVRGAWIVHGLHDVDRHGGKRYAHSSTIHSLQVAPKRTALRAKAVCIILPTRQPVGTGRARLIPQTSSEALHSLLGAE